ncbi:hypothetical protein [Streptomyces sp. NPDC057403]|uniref:hypothetical protein n=1 Tax=Streptomyces sp. NPDC057403 TaxID=3346119 RepID=UPI00369E58C8
MTSIPTRTAAVSGLDELLAALPATVDTVARKTLPSRYTPELAQQLAGTIAAALVRTPQTAGGAR